MNTKNSNTQYQYCTHDVCACVRTHTHTHTHTHNYIYTKYILYVHITCCKHTYVRMYIHTYIHTEETVINEGRRLAICMLVRSTPLVQVVYVPNTRNALSVYYDGCPSQCLKQVSPQACSRFYPRVHHKNLVILIYVYAHLILRKL